MSDPMNDPKNLPIEDKMDLFAEGFRDLMEKLGFDESVLVIRVGDTKYVAARFPGCPNECNNPMDCTINEFERAAADLKAQAAIMRNKKGGPMNGPTGGYIQ